MKAIGEEIKDGDRQLAVIEKQQQEFLDALPNLPADDVVAGGKENNQGCRNRRHRPCV